MKILIYIKSSIYILWLQEVLAIDWIKGSIHLIRSDQIVAFITRVLQLNVRIFANVKIITPKFFVKLVNKKWSDVIDIERRF